MRNKSKGMTKAIVVGSLILVCSLALLASGCSDNNNDEAAAIQVGENLKKLQYEIQLPTKKVQQTLEQDVEDMLKELEAYKPYLTEKGYETFSASRQNTIATGYAQKNKLNMKVKKIEFENRNQDTAEKDTFSFRYSIEIELSPAELTSSKGTSVVTKTGQMTVVKEADEWKVLKDLDKGFLLDE